MRETEDDCTSASSVPGIGPQTFVDFEDAETLPIIVHAFSSLDVGARATIVGGLLASVGPLALAVVASGAFAKYVRYARSPRVPVSPDDAALITPNQIAEVVRYVRQSNPKCFERVLLSDLSCPIDLRSQDSNTTDS